MKKNFRFISVFLCFVLLLMSVTACKTDKATTEEEDTEVTTSTETATTESATTEAAVELEPLEYSVLTVFDETASLGYDNPNDIVTPEIEKKFNIKVSDVTFNGGMSPIERMNMLVAADTVPDVVLVDNPNVAAFYATGEFMDLSEFMSLLPNTDKYISDAGWNRLKVDGKLVAIPGDMSGGEIDVNNPEIADFVKNDTYYSRPSNWALVVNESILKQAGYEFKITSELQAELDAQPRPITDADVQIVPALKTTDDFVTLLKKIKDLNLMVDGKPVIPLSIPEWAAFHLSVLNAPTGGWYCDPATMDVTGYLFNPGMKEFYQLWKKLFDEGLLDQEYIFHKGEQYQEKAASGRVAVMLPAFDVAAVRANLQANGSDLRVIPYPESTAGHSVDASFPSGFKNIMINKNFKDPERLLAYFDWMQTEEAKDLCSWGPESAGLWEIKDGVKMFKDDVLAQAILTNGKTEDGKGAEYYGLTADKSYALATLCAPGLLYNEKAVARSYPLKMDAYKSSYIYLSTNMLNRDGTVLPNAGEKSNLTGGYYWSVVKSTMVAELLSTKSEDEFEKVWNSMLEDFKTNAEYEAGAAEMLSAFKVSLGK